MTFTKKLFLWCTPFAIAVEAFFAFRLWHYWVDLKGNDNLSGAYQAAAALLVGWPTVCFALAATYAGFRSAMASERQAEAADRQAAAADAQAVAARMSIRPALIPYYDRNGANVEISIVNKGTGLATQITWVLLILKERAPLNAFIRPRDLGLQEVERGGFSGSLQNGEHDSQIIGWRNEEFLLLLVNCIDLSDNICQSQLLIMPKGPAIKAILGFATRTLPERMEIQVKHGTIGDPEIAGVTAW